MRLMVHDIRIPTEKCNGRPIVTRLKTFVPQILGKYSANNSNLPTKSAKNQRKCALSVTPSKWTSRGISVKACFIPIVCDIHICTRLCVETPRALKRSLLVFESKKYGDFRTSWVYLPHEQSFLGKKFKFFVGYVRTLFPRRTPLSSRNWTKNGQNCENGFADVRTPFWFILTENVILHHQK